MTTVRRLLDMIHIEAFEQNAAAALLHERFEGPTVEEMKQQERERFKFESGARGPRIKRAQPWQDRRREYVKSKMPIRVQRKRTSGWKMPAGAIYVGRPSKFGNPYKEKEFGLDLAMKLFAETARGCWDPSLFDKADTDQRVHRAYELHCTWLERIGHKPTETIRTELRGRDLACFCSLKQPCHADILLEIANNG